MAWKAVSRGLAPDPRNPGPMSRDTIAALRDEGISVDEYLRMPIQVTAEDFAANQHIVAVKEQEHRPMIQRAFLDWLAKVEFWQVHDLDCCGPEETLPHLDREVTGLLLRLRAAQS